MHALLMHALPVQALPVQALPRGAHAARGGARAASCRAQVQKRVGKPIMSRSQPLHRAKRAETDDSGKLDEEDDVNFYLALS